MGFMEPGNVVWFEISTADGQAVQVFYGPLLGCSFAVDPDSSVGGMTYTRIMAPGMPFPMGAIYEGPGGEVVNVAIVSADVAACQAKLERLGAQVVVPATAVGDVTTFARLADPRGNVFTLFQNNRAPQRLAEFAEQAQDQMGEMAATPVPGSYAWFEIGTGDAAATESFYGQAFGWRFEFDDTAGDKPYSSIFTGNPWPSGGLHEQGIDYVMPAFLVEDVPAVAAKALELGGTVEYGPDSDPDGRVYTRLLDPRDNRFGVFSMATQAAS